MRIAPAVTEVDGRRFSIEPAGSWRNDGVLTCPETGNSGTRLATWLAADQIRAGAQVAVGLSVFLLQRTDR